MATNITKLNTGDAKIIRRYKTKFNMDGCDVVINNIMFSRISNANGDVVWTDLDSYFGQRDLMCKKREAELESIYSAIV